MTDKRKALEWIDQRYKGYLNELANPERTEQATKRGMKRIQEGIAVCETIRQALTEPENGIIKDTATEEKGIIKDTEMEEAIAAIKKAELHVARFCLTNNVSLEAIYALISAGVIDKARDALKQWRGE